MKKRIIIVLSLATSFINACVEVEPFNGRVNKTDAQLNISSFNPNAAACGSEITLIGENFGISISENFVTLDNWGSDLNTGRIAKVTDASYPGRITVRIPMNLNPGDYYISLMVEGKSTRTEQPFKIISD
jgi:hypothetical protein